MSQLKPLAAVLLASSIIASVAQAQVNLSAETSAPTGVPGTAIVSLAEVASKSGVANIQVKGSQTLTNSLQNLAEGTTDIAAVLRRIAALPTPEGAAGIGLVICDGSGTLTLRKPVEGFPLPRLSAACPLWPLYQALNRPMSPVRAVVEMPGRDTERFLTYAIAQPVGPTLFDRVSMFEATMVMLPADRVSLPEGAIAQIGTSCRICPQQTCAARREPSILVQTA